VAFGMIKSAGFAGRRRRRTDAPERRSARDGPEPDGGRPGNGSAVTRG